jgi:hypothetical protein
MNEYCVPDPKFANTDKGNLINQLVEDLTRPTNNGEIF